MAKGRGGRASRRQWLLQTKNQETEDRKKMKELGLDEEAYREYKKLPARPTGPSGVAGQLTLGNIALGAAGGNVQRDFQSEVRSKEWDDRVAELRRQTKERADKKAQQEAKDYTAVLHGKATSSQDAARVAEEEKKAQAEAATKVKEVKKDEPVKTLEPINANNATKIVQTPTVPAAKPTERELVSQRVRNYNEMRRKEEIQAIRDRAEEGRKEREATKAKYAKENYDKAKFSTREGWANLGLREGEKSGASFAEGTAERKAYDERVARVREGLKASGDSYKNGYISNGGSIAGISKTFEEGAAAGTLSDKQLEALEKKIGNWSKIASDKKAFIDRQTAVLEEQSARRYLGEAGRGLGREAAVALANGQRLTAVKDAAKGLSDPMTKDEDRLKHSETLLRHGIDTEAIGRNLVESDQKLRDRFVKESGGKTDSETFGNLYRTYGLESISGAKSFGDVLVSQTGKNGVGAWNPEFVRQQERDRDAKMDQALAVVDSLKPKEEPNPVKSAITGALDTVKNLFTGGKETQELEPKTDDDVDDELGVSAARRGGFARRAITPSVLKPRG